MSNEMLDGIGRALNFDAPRDIGAEEIRAEAARLEKACRTIARSMREGACRPQAPAALATFAEATEAIVELAGRKAALIRAEDAKELQRLCEDEMRPIAGLGVDARGKVEPEVMRSLATRVDDIERRQIDLPLALHRRAAWQECLVHLTGLVGPRR